MAGSVVATSSARKGQGIVKITSTLTCAGGALSATIIGKAYGRIVGVAFRPDAWRWRYHHVVRSPDRH
jgi:hypothetical protein